ncbi:unnamed protein product [marine sediment metagenome]|uniref:Uncharacterized protein n=1 Tax=marine sediment metagenome TaxID=412755 RepID=X1SGT7_9ZZZZ
MVTEIWDYINEKFRRWRSDAEGRGVTLPEGQYTVVPPALAGDDYHNLTLTADGKLRVDDPTTQAAIGALDDKIDIVQADLDIPVLNWFVWNIDDIHPHTIWMSAEWLSEEKPYEMQMAVEMRDLNRLLKMLIGV